jgi:hypothetical protein
VKGTQRKNTVTIATTAARTPEPAVACPACSAAEFLTPRQTAPDGPQGRLNCAACGRPFLELPNSQGGAPTYQFRRRAADAHADELAPPAKGWAWLGLVRQGDGVWRPVALCATAADCWQALLGCWMHGDLMAVPVRASTKGPAEPEAPGGAGFVGWHRPGRGRKPWKAVARGETEAECFSRLLTAVAGGDKLVLPAGQDPNTRSGRR